MQPLEIKVIHNAAQLRKVWRDEEIILASYTWWSCDLFHRFSSLSLFAVPCVFALLNELSWVFLIPFPLLLSFFLFVWREKSLTPSFSDTMKVVSLARDLTSYNLINLKFSSMMDKKFGIYFSLLRFLSLSLFFRTCTYWCRKRGREGRRTYNIYQTKTEFFFFFYLLFLFFLLINKTKN